FFVHQVSLTYLQEVCPQAGYKLCAYIGILNSPNEFTWSTDILEKTGGFAGIADESKRIVMGTISAHPAEVARMVADNFFAALNAHKPTAFIMTNFYHDSIVEVLKSKFGPGAAAAFLASAQMQNTIPHTMISAIDAILTPVMFLLLILLGYASARRGLHAN